MGEYNREGILSAIWKGVVSICLVILAAGIFKPVVYTPTPQVPDVTCMEKLRILDWELDEYRYAHGEYPETLDQLVPDQLREVPMCPHRKEGRYSIEMSDEYAVAVCSVHGTEINYVAGLPANVDEVEHAWLDPLLKISILTLTLGGTLMALLWTRRKKAGPGVVEWFVPVVLSLGAISIFAGIFLPFGTDHYGFHQGLRSFLPDGLFPPVAVILAASAALAVVAGFSRKLKRWKGDVPAACIVFFSELAALLMLPFFFVEIVGGTSRESLLPGSYLLACGLLVIILGFVIARNQALLRSHPERLSHPVYLDREDRDERTWLEE